MYLEDIFHFIVVAKHKQKQCPIFELIVLYLPWMMIAWKEHCHVGSASPITVWWSFFRSFTRFPIFSQQLFLVKTDSRQLHSRRRRVMLLLANYDKHFWATDRNKNRRLCTYLRLNKCTWFMLLKEIDTCVCQKERSLCSCNVWTTLEFVFAFLLPNNLSTLEPITFHSIRGGTLFVS